MSDGIFGNSSANSNTKTEEEEFLSQLKGKKRKTFLENSMEFVNVQFKLYSKTRWAMLEALR